MQETVNLKYYIGQALRTPMFPTILQETVKKLGGNVTQDTLNINIPKDKQTELWNTFDETAKEILSKKE